MKGRVVMSSNSDLSSSLAPFVMNYINIVLEGLKELFSYLDTMTGIEISEIIATIIQG